MAEEFDIAVVGGGPAGAATALCLARGGWRIALLERRSLDQARAGETLPPEINPVLRSLGVVGNVSFAIPTGIAGSSFDLGQSSAE